MYKRQQLAISQRAQTLDEARAIQDAQQFTQQLAQAQQIQNQQLEQQRRLEAARLAADPRSIAALTTVYGQCRSGVRANPIDRD